MMNYPNYYGANPNPQTYGMYTGAATMSQTMPTPMNSMPTSMTSMPTPMTSMPTPMTSMPTPMTPSIPPTEESYIENILRLNLGKVATIYMTFENNSQWNAKIFQGVLEAAGRDHIIISDQQTGTRYLLLMVNLDYITFDEELSYSYPVRNYQTLNG